MYLRAFGNWEQDDWARLLPIVKFAYNNAKNASIGHTLFKLNYDYYLRVSFKEDVDLHSRSRSTNKLAKELRELMEVCCLNLLYVKELQKRTDDKEVKNRNYASSKKIWLNNKYIKIKQNKKLKNKFFGLFQVFHKVEKQAYKQELPTNWKIYNVFHVLLLKQDITKKRRVDNTLPGPKNDLEFEARGNREYEFETIIDSAVYG